MGKCDASGTCPIDVPAGATDKPQCALQDQSGDKYCALTCVLGGCPTGAKCAHIGGIMGICVYPSSEETKPKLNLLPAPLANASHYEKPPCQSDETEASVQGADGSLCAPKCDSSGSCPTNVPAGATDKPQCILQDQSGDKYCALECILGGCPTGAKCVHIGGIMGICVYPSSEETKPKLK